MTGQIRSFGCRTCKERRVKCDETRPICKRCVKANRLCPGPLPVYQIRWNQNPRNETGDLCEIPKSERQRNAPLLLKKSRSTAGGALYQTLEVLPRASEIQPNQRIEIPKSPSLTRADRLSYSSIEAIPYVTSLDLHATEFGSFFRHVPLRVGQNRALDDAIACIVNSWQTSRRGETQRRRDYAKALVSLQQCLDNKLECKSSETLGAALLLCEYEKVCARNEGGENWLAHAGGASSLIQARGASSFKTDFEKQMILSHQSNMVAVAIVSASDCFLNFPRWESLFSSIFDHTNLSNKDAKANMMYHKVMHALGGFVPSILRQLRKITTEEYWENISSGYSLVQEFKARLSSFESYFESTLNDGGETSFSVPTPEDDPPSLCQPHSRSNLNKNAFSSNKRTLIKYSSEAVARAHVHFYASKALASLLLAFFDSSHRSYFQHGPRVPIPYIDYANSLNYNDTASLFHFFVPISCSQISTEISRCMSLLRASIPSYRHMKALSFRHRIFVIHMASVLATTDEKEQIVKDINELFDCSTSRLEVKYNIDGSRGLDGGIVT